MLKKELNRQKRHWKIKKTIIGTAEKPRLVINRSLQNFSYQIIDDIDGKVVTGAGTMAKSFKQSVPYGGNIAAAVALGKSCAEVLKKKGIGKISFDRAGFKYHGRIKAFADTLREEGIQF